MQTQHSTSHPMQPVFALNKACNHFFPLIFLGCLLSGCVAQVQIPTIDQFHIASGAHDKSIDAGVHGTLLLTNLYALMKANEDIEVPICTAAQDSHQCIKDGFSVFVLGGPLPGMGGRSCYQFSKISISANELEFTKDNRSTTFIGTPMYTQENQCQVRVKNGGLEVTMDRYYASWMGVGQMFMAEGWAIDYMDLQQGIVGLQLQLDIKGLLTTGGGSPYILLKFPHLPAPL